MGFVGFSAAMMKTLPLHADLVLGIVPAHLRFVGGLVPDEAGCLPRNDGGELVVVAGIRELRQLSPVALRFVQVPLFPGTLDDDLDELVSSIRNLDMEVDFVLMLGGADPMKPEDEDAVVAQLLPNLQAAVRHRTRHVSSTSIEGWMGAEPAREGEAYEAAIAQNAKVHARAYREAGLEGSSVRNWHIEFLRPGEFKTFTSLARGWDCVRAMNRHLGRPFFKILVDAAHCGDSGLPLAENLALLPQIAAAGELGIFHASAKTTRGCLSTDDGWVGAMLTGMAATGALRHVYLEMFDHEDPALEPLRRLEPGHGPDTRDGRSYAEVVADGLAYVTRRLNNLVVRGIL